MPDRSYLFVPADRPERIDKALQSGAHAVIVDLEDAVLPAHKDHARQQLAQWLGHASTSVYVRINAADSPWYTADCTLLRSPHVRGVMLPKADHTHDIAQLAGQLQGAQSIIALIETVSGWFNTAAIARAPRVQQLAFGSVDFMADSGIAADGPALDVVRTHLVLHAKHAGLPAPIDGVSLAIHDVATLEADARRAKQRGFGAKLCIHPSQVPVVHRCFAASAQEVQWAHKVIEALEQGPAGAITVDGKLVDKAVILMAQNILQTQGVESANTGLAAAASL